MRVRTAILAAGAAVMAIAAFATPVAAGPSPPSEAVDPVYVGVFQADPDDVDRTPNRLDFVVASYGVGEGVDERLRSSLAVISVTPAGGGPHRVGRVQLDPAGGSEYSVDPCRIGGKDLPDERFTVAVEDQDVNPPYRSSRELRLGPDMTKPKVKKIQSSPPPESKVEKGDTIRFEVVAKEDDPGSTWQTGVQMLQVLGPRGLIKDDNAGRSPKACKEKSSLTIEDKYKVRGSDPAVIEICGIADDYVPNQGSNCAQYYKGEVWEGTFRQKNLGCTGVDKWKLQVVVADDDSATGNGTLTSPGILCPNSALAPAGLTLQTSGNRDRTGFHLTFVPCACPPLDLSVTGNKAEGSAQDPPPSGATYRVNLTCKTCE